jgi:hypothetical protein
VKWPFGNDADRDDPLTSLRIAVASPYAEWCYLVTFDRDSAERPTEREARMLASYLDEYKAHWYCASYQAKLAERPLDVDDSAIGVTFHKYAEGDWGYRRRSWILGPQFIPEPARAGRARKLGPFDLERLMDHIYALGGEAPDRRWLDWKAGQPEVWGLGTA